MIKTEREKNAHVVIDGIFTEMEKVVQIVERYLGIFLYCRRVFYEIFDAERSKIYH